jgi:Vitamin K epoxide reductase family
MTLNRWSALLALLGLAISVYLMVVHYAQGQVPLACASGGVVNCELVTSSAESGVGPVPVALLGVVWFGMYLGLVLRGTAGPYRLAWAATGLAFGVPYPARVDELTYPLSGLARSPARQPPTGTILRSRRRIDLMMRGKHTHPKECADQAAATIDRKMHEEAAKKREVHLQRLARAEWFDWFPPHRVR